MVSESSFALITLRAPRKCWPSRRMRQGGGLKMAEEEAGRGASLLLDLLSRFSRTTIVNSLVCPPVWPLGLQRAALPSHLWKPKPIAYHFPGQSLGNAGSCRLNVTLSGTPPSNRALRKILDSEDPLQVEGYRLDLQPSNPYPSTLHLPSAMTTPQ